MTRKWRGPKTLLRGDLLSLITSFMSSGDANQQPLTSCELSGKEMLFLVGAHKMDLSMKVDKQALTRLEKGLAWSLAASERFSLPWHADGQSWYVHACHSPAFCLLSHHKSAGCGAGEDRCHGLSAALF